MRKSVKGAEDSLVCILCFPFLFPANSKGIKRHRQRQIFAIPSYFLGSFLIPCPKHRGKNGLGIFRFLHKNPKSMQYGKLVKVLRQFKPVQLKRLEKFLLSPYFQVYQPSVLLFQQLQKLYPQFNETHIPAATAHHRLKSIKQQEVAGARLMRAIEKFRAMEEAQKHPATPHLPLLQALRKHQPPGEFDKQLKKDLAALQHHPEQNIDTFYGKHLLTELQLSGFDARLHRSNANSILPVMKTLDEFYALKKLRYLCEALNRKLSLGTEVLYHEQHIPTLLAILQPYNNPQYPYVYLFVNVYHLLAATTYTDGEIYYGLLKQYINTHSKGKHLLPCITEAVNYVYNSCLRWYNTGNETAAKEFLWWIEWKEKHKLLLENGKLMPVTFRNTITALLQHHSPKETEQLITRYSPHLPREYRSTYTAFANALLQYSLKNHQQAARLFAKAQAGEDLVFNCTIRRWQWINLYESNPTDTDILCSRLDAFDKHLLRYKKQLQHVLPQFTVFINYACELIQAGAKEVTLLQLQAEPHFAGKPWLLQQMEIKNKKPVRKAHGQKVTAGRV